MRSATRERSWTDQWRARRLRFRAASRPLSRAPRAARLAATLGRDRGHGTVIGVTGRRWKTPDRFRSDRPRPVERAHAKTALDRTGARGYACAAGAFRLAVGTKRPSRLSSPTTCTEPST